MRKQGRAQKGRVGKSRAGKRGKGRDARQEKEKRKEGMRRRKTKTKTKESREKSYVNYPKGNQQDPLFVEVGASYTERVSVREKGGEGGPGSIESLLGLVGAQVIARRGKTEWCEQRSGTNDEGIWGV